ncbi:MAG: imidazolonepropionase [Calditrichaeota bacterium]|nr:imidazolonepropionase [Calditrichota bacterium]MCB9366245.1 imidazolonepropionase [Calditrichota bacterium]MCB9391686.1 imidazolonepropionase [Calditrichota bacterium]
MESTLLHDIGLLVTPLEMEMNDHRRPVYELQKAAVWIEDGRFKQIARSEELLKSVPASVTRVHAQNKLMVPGFVDCHAHPVFVGNRAKEFFLRNQGASYQDIAAAGGGIHATAERIKTSRVDQIVRESLPRFHRSLEFGVTTLECKSGYGLTWDSEEKLLIALREIAKVVPQRLSKTFLVHVVPAEWKDRREEFVEAVMNEMIPEVAARGLANCVDVFCEEGAFTVDESRKILQVALDEGLSITIHANQFGHSGGARLAAELGARSADHLEYLSEDEMDALREAGVPGVALPACVFFMGTIPYPPMRKMIDRGMRIALATDMNPGTAMTESLPFCMTAAAIYGKLKANELLWAVTLDPARILGVSGNTGSIEAGKYADFSLWSVPSLESIPYFFGQSGADSVWIEGAEVFTGEDSVKRY